nr:hypothetical protein [Thioalkalivibrio sp.]
MRPASRAWLLALVLALAALPPTGAMVAEGESRRLYVQPSPLAGVVAGFAEAPAAARFDFARLLIDALVTAYESELDSSVFEGRRDAADRRKLARWQQATLPLLAELRVAQAALYVASHVEVRMDRHNQILVLIDGRPLWVAWPRITAQPRLEQELAAEFCRRHDCARDGGDGSTRAALGPAGVQGHWQLSQRHPPAWETADGLRCEFADLAERGAKEATCRAIVADLHALALVLREASRGGERVQWERLSLQADTGAGPQRVTVNERGDYVQASVPALAAHPVDWTAAGRWLQARAQGRPMTATVLPATRRR